MRGWSCLGEACCIGTKYGDKLSLGWRPVHQRPNWDATKQQIPQCTSSLGFTQNEDEWKGQSCLVWCSLPDVRRHLFLSRHQSSLTGRVRWTAVAASRGACRPSSTWTSAATCLDRTYSSMPRCTMRPTRPSRAPRSSSVRCGNRVLFAKEEILCLCGTPYTPRVSSLLLFPTFWDFYFFLLFHKIPTFSYFLALEGKISSYFL